MAEPRCSGGRSRSSVAALAARAWPWAKLALGVTLLGLLVWLVDWAGTWAILRRSDPWLVLSAAVLVVLALVVSTAKWERLVRLGCGRVEFLALLRAYWIGSFLSNYLPSNVGGDVVRVLVLREVAAVTPLAGSVLVERLTGVATLAVLSAVCLTLRPVTPWELNLALWLLVAAIFGGILLALTIPGRVARAGGSLGARLPALARRLLAKLGHVGDAVLAYRAAPGELAVASLWSCVFYGVLTLFQFSLLRAVGSSITLAEAALVAPLVPLVSLLPVTANGLGLTEGAFVLFYVQMGVPPEQALAAALLRRLLTVAASVPGGLMWLRTGRRPRAVATAAAAGGK